MPDPVREVDRDMASWFYEAPFPWVAPSSSIHCIYDRTMQDTKKDLQNRFGSGRTMNECVCSTGWILKWIHSSASFTVMKFLKT